MISQKCSLLLRFHQNNLLDSHLALGPNSIKTKGYYANHPGGGHWHSGSRFFFTDQWQVLDTNSGQMSAFSFLICRQFAALSPRSPGTTCPCKAHKEALAGASRHMACTEPRASR